MGAQDVGGGGLWWSLRVCTVTVVVSVVVRVVVVMALMMALRRDLMIDQVDCGQAQTASSRASVVPRAHVKWLGGWKKGTCCRALGLKGDDGGSSVLLTD